MANVEWIDEALSEGVVPDEIPVEVAPATDRAEVNRLLRRLRHVHRQQDQVNGTYKTEMAALVEWRDARLQTLLTVERYIARSLEGWTRATYRDERTKTHDLPAGVLRLRPRARTVQIVDPEAFLWWVLDTQRWGLVKIEPSKGSITSVCDVGDKVDDQPADAEPDTLDYAVTVPTFDSETGEVGDPIVVPGVVFRSGDTSTDRGYTFSVTPRETGEHGETDEQGA